MALKKAARTAQYVMSADFQFNFDDTMVDINGVSQSFSAALAGVAFDVINLPPGSRVVGGDLLVETAFNGTTCGVKIGDAGLDSRYLGSTDVKAAGRTALVPTAFRNDAGNNLRMTVTSTGTQTAGKAAVRVEYVIDGRANESQTA